ncbi:hypothetical protein VTO73DRAFT_4512 [Trametes versicolor]
MHAHPRPRCIIPHACPPRPHIALCHRYLPSYRTPHPTLARPPNSYDHSCFMRTSDTTGSERTLHTHSVFSHLLPPWTLVFFLSVSLTPVPPPHPPLRACCLRPAQSPAGPHPPSRFLAPPIGYLLCYPAPSARPPYSLYVPPYLGPPNYLRTPSPPRRPLGRARPRRTRTRIRPLY